MPERRRNDPEDDIHGALPRSQLPTFIHRSATDLQPFLEGSLNDGF